MKKLIIIQNKILHYRIPLYNELSKYYNLTIIHSGASVYDEYTDFNELILPIRNIGPFILQSGLISEIKKQNPHFIIAMFDIHWVYNIYFAIRRNKFKFIWWGLGRSKSLFSNLVKSIIANLGHPIIFYNDYSLNQINNFLLSSVPKYIANNTIDVPSGCKSHISSKKNNIIFVGSFDSRKRLDILCSVFIDLLPSISNDINLVLVGDGLEYNNIKCFVNESGYSDRIVLKGRINSVDELLKIYKYSIVNVSVGQAGLSVLQSFGFGVPFITFFDSISSGETSNIIDGFNGYLCKDRGDLLYYLNIICNDLHLARKLGKNAYNYYNQECTIENMAQGFINAIESQA